MRSDVCAVAVGRFSGDRRPIADGSRRKLVNESEVELSLGETVQIGDYSVTIIDIEGDQIQFRVDASEEDDGRGFDMRRWIRPR